MKHFLNIGFTFLGKITVKIIFLCVAFTCSDGFQKIWTNIVEKEKLDVKFYQDIISVERKTKQVILTTWDSTKSKKVPYNCDFLIWSAPMTEFLRYMHGQHDN